MPLTLPASCKEFMQGSSLHLAVCWRIERRDGEVLLVTTHARELEVDGEKFTPTAGIEPVAVQDRTGLEPATTEAAGFIDDERVTLDDLRAGLYRGAEVTEYLVDWRFPFAGIIARSTYWITRTRCSGEQWTADCSGITYLLEKQVGSTFASGCGATLGDERCMVDLTPYTYEVRVNAASDRKGFDANNADIVGGLGDDYFQYGLIRWQSGKNKGQTSEVRGYTDVGRLFDLEVALPHTPEDGDRFTLTRGCDGTFATCRIEFGNDVNYKGFRRMPGTDDSLTSPT